MKRFTFASRVKVGALAMALLVAADTKPVRALGFPNIPWAPPIPPIPIPDLCPTIVGCPVTFTNMTFLLQLQQYHALLQNFANIHNIAGLQGAIQQTVAILHASQAAPPMQQATVAATTTITTEPTTQTRITAIDAQAQAADGVQQQGQAENAYLSTIAGGVDKTNTLLATKLAQDNARDVDSVVTFDNATANAVWDEGATL